MGFWSDLFGASISPDAGGTASPGAAVVDTTTPMQALPDPGQPVTGSVDLSMVGTPAPAGTPDLSVAVSPTSIVGKAASGIASGVSSLWSWIKALPIIAIVILSIILGLYVISWLPRRR